MHQKIFISTHLRLFARAVGLIPSTTLHITSKIHAIFLIFILIILFFANLTVYVLILPNVTSWKFISDWILDFFVVIFCVCFVIKGNFCNETDWKVLYEICEVKVDQRDTQRFQLNFFLFNALYLFYFCGLLWMKLTFYPKFAFVIFPMSLNKYIITLTILCMHNFTSKLGILAKDLQSTLKSCLDTIIEVSKDETNQFLIVPFVSRRKSTEQCFWKYLKVNKGIKAFNGIYGIQVLFISAVLFMVLTVTTNMFLWQTENACSKEKWYCFLSIVFKSISILHLLISGVLLVESCSKITQEINLVAKECCSTLIELPHAADELTARIFKLKFIILNKELLLQQPYFTASDWFEINYGMLLAIFTGVMNFVIFYVQLNV